MTTTYEKIYGLQFQEESDGERLRWHILIHHPFRQADGKLRIGINEKALRTAMQRGIEKFVIGDKLLEVPTEKALKAMIKRKSFEMKQSIFAGREDYRIFHFVL